MRWGERRNQLMRIYNIREGLTKEDDRLPEKFYKEEIKTGRLKGSVIEKEKFQQAIYTYYEMMGWDSDGIPLDGTLYDFNLEWTIPILEKYRESMLT